METIYTSYVNPVCVPTEKHLQALKELEALEMTRSRMRGLYWRMTSKQKDYGAQRDLQIEIMRVLGTDFVSPMDKWSSIGAALNKRERELIDKLHGLDVRNYRIDNA
jgi:hypothetical protein